MKSYAFMNRRVVFIISQHLIGFNIEILIITVRVVMSEGNPALNRRLPPISAIPQTKVSIIFIVSKVILHSRNIYGSLNIFNQINYL